MRERRHTMRLFVVAGALVLLLVCVPVFADTVELKNGDKIEGRITEETDTAIKIETDYGPLVIPRSQIAKVVKGAGEKKEEAEKPAGVVVELKNGDKIQGEIIEETKEAIKIKTSYGELTIPREKIAKITGTKPGPKPEPKPAEEESRNIVIELKNGDKIEGEILEESDTAIKVKTAYGPLTIPRSQIAKITKAAARPSGEILEKSRALADKHYELAMWAKENELEDEMKEHLEAAIELYPDHEKARAALGYVKKDGKWVKNTETKEPVEPKDKMTAEELLQAHQEAQGHLQAQEYEKALEIYRKILKSYPDDITGNYNTACLLSLDKKIDEALKYLEHAIRKAREAMDTGTWEEQQNAKSIIDLLPTDSDLDNLRETEKFKEIEKIAAGKKVEPEEETEKEEEKEEEKATEEPGEPYLTIQMIAMPRTEQAEQRVKRMEQFLKGRFPDLNVRMDEENIYIEIGRYKLSERDKAEERLKEIEEASGRFGGAFRGKIVTVGGSEEGEKEEEPDEEKKEEPEKPKKKKRDF
jgi:RNase P/RNase MRP subunit p29